MKRARKPSAQTLAVLDALGMRPSDWLYGLELSKLTGLKSGSLYPLLIRLAERGLLESKWIQPSEAGRPPRHAYRISAKGAEALAAATAKAGRAKRAVA
jgi:DNA-binding PadR family transcriptional regulator